MTLPPSELAARLDRILASAGRLVASVPMPYLEHRALGGGLCVRDRAYRVFRLALAYVDGMDLGRLPAEWVEQNAPPDLRDGDAVARYGALVRGRVGGWFEGAGPGEYARVIDVYDGPRSGHDLLEQMTARAARSLIELYAMVDDLGITPPEPLSAADLDGLPLPPSVPAPASDARS
jgi:hypothetical protein